MNCNVVEGDLLDQDVDVIVNAWNRNIIPWWLLLPQGVSGAIKKRGGTGPFKELAAKAGKNSKEYFLGVLNRFAASNAIQNKSLVFVECFDIDAPRVTNQCDLSVFAIL